MNVFTLFPAASVLIVHSLMAAPFDKVRRDAPAGLTVLAASASDEITATLDEQGHGLFTYHLLKGLGGSAKDASGRVTPRGLHDYLLPRVQDDARRQNRE